MNGEELLVALEAAGAELALEGPEVRVVVPSARVTPTMREALQDKTELTRAYLRREWRRYLDGRPPVTADPRPDLAADHTLWELLLSMAWGSSNKALFWSLNGLRCLGAHLVRLDGMMCLVCGEMAPEEYAADRERYLVPHTNDLVGLLAELGRHEERMRRMRRVATP